MLWGLSKTWTTSGICCSRRLARWPVAGERAKGGGGIFVGWLMLLSCHFKRGWFRTFLCHLLMVFQSTCWFFDWNLKGLGTRPVALALGFLGKLSWMLSISISWGVPPSQRRPRRTHCTVWRLGECGEFGWVEHGQLWHRKKTRGSLTFHEIPIV